MTLIYSDSEVIDLEWIPHLRFSDQVNTCHSLAEYCETTADLKIAFTAHRMHLSYDEPGTYESFEHKVLQLSASSDLVFCIESELHNYHWAMYDQCHRPNVYWCQPGMINDRPDMASHIIFWGDWFKTSTAVYRALPDQLAQLKPFDVKPRSFDALLGSPKPHRTFVAQAVQQHQLEDQFVLTYGGAWKNTEFYAKDYFVWEPNCVPLQTIIGTADWVSYHGHQCHLSQVIPTQVYNDTAYSIVAETDHDNTLSFFSEKTAKVFIARRLFVAFSGYRFLHNLRQLGFRTFDAVIDESYDLIVNDQDRYTAAFAQVKKLCELPQQQVLQTIQSVVEHNHNLIMMTDWNRMAREQIQHKINQVVANKH